MSSWLRQRTRGCSRVLGSPRVGFRGVGAHMSVLAVPPSESDMSMVSLWLR